MSGLAVASLVMGVLGFTCFPGVAGVAAIAFGLAARNEIAQSEGRHSGMGIATAGIVTGTLSIAVAILGIAALVTLIARPKPYPRSSPTPPPTAHHRYTSPSPSASTLVSPSGAIHRGIRSTRIGAVVLVDLGPSVKSLDRALDSQRKVAARERRRLLLWVSHDGCEPCNGVAASLLDPLVQDALREVILIRVDVRDYRLDLTQRGIPTRVIPGFALLDTDNRPVDYLHGGEWDEDIPQNIAPVLGAFVAGTYTSRRHPWESLPDPNITPILHF